MAETTGIDLSRTGKLIALTAGLFGVGEDSTTAADTFYSGKITSGNLIGWNPAPTLLTPTSFAIGISNGRQFHINASTFVFSGISIRGIGANYIDPLPASTFALGVLTASVAYPLVQRFNLGDKLTTAANALDAAGSIGAITSNNGVYGGTTAQESSYLLFKFEDGGTDFYGWVSVDIDIEGDYDTGTIYLRVDSYAWQSSVLGVLSAGALPVPEPSTLVTSGIAALAGGAVGLRRWRRERKAKSDVA